MREFASATSKVRKIIHKLESGSFAPEESCEVLHTELLRLLSSDLILGEISWTYRKSLEDRKIFSSIQHLIYTSNLVWQAIREGIAYYGIQYSSVDAINWHFERAVSSSEILHLATFLFELVDEIYNKSGQVSASLRTNCATSLFGPFVQPVLQKRLEALVVSVCHHFGDVRVWELAMQKGKALKTFVFIVQVPHVLSEADNKFVEKVLPLYMGNQEEEVGCEVEEPPTKRRRTEQLDRKQAFFEQFGELLSTHSSDAFQKIVAETKGLDSADLPLKKLYRVEQFRRGNVLLELGNFQEAEKLFSLTPSCPWELLRTKLVTGVDKGALETVSDLSHKGVVPEYSVCKAFLSRHNSHSLALGLHSVPLHE